MSRIVMVGAPGSGKSTLAREVARRLDLAYVERDAHNHGDDPEDGPPVRQRAGVLAALDAASGGWVLDGAPYWYEEEVYPRATLVVGLDFPKALVIWRCMVRSVRNLVRGTERFRDVFAETHPIRWAWKVHGQRRLDLAALAGRVSGDVVILRSPREARLWLEGFVAGARAV